MKNSKGETLKQPHLALAEMRRAQYDGTLNYLLSAFDWSLTNEGHFFWQEVYAGDTPAIPASSLAELEEWRKAKEVPAEPATEWKAKYDDLEYEYHKLKFDFEIAVTEAEESAADLRDLQTKYDELKAGDYKRNWVAECAMAAMQGLLAYYSGGSATRPKDDMLSEKSWTLAEAWSAEGRKRGHLPKIENE